MALQSILGLVARCRPHLIILHGNALKAANGKLLLLVGDSGVGKSTLTEMLAVQQLAEDLIFIDPQTGLVHPFLRAATAPGAGAWTRIDGTPRTLRQIENGLHEAQSVADAVVVRLHRQLAPPALGIYAYLSFFSDALASDLRTAGLNWEEVREFSGSTRLRFAALSDADCATIQQVAERHGALLLQAGEGTASTLPPALEPYVREVPPMEGLLGILPQVRRYVIGEPPGLLLMRLAGTLASARHLDCLVGGTPEQTAESILAQLSSR